jgi:hypothetical protein
MAYPCDAEDGNAAVMLITNLENGDTFAACGQCFPVWVAAAAEQFTSTRGEPDGPAPDDGQDQTAGRDGTPVPDMTEPPSTRATRPRKRAGANP